MGVSIIKICSICNINKSLNEFYSQQKKKANGEQYTYYHPYCKDCTKTKSAKWQKDNREQHNDSMKEYFKTDKGKKARKNYKKYGEMLRKWQKANPDRVKEHNEHRRQNKTHEISKEEWEYCKQYFDNACAYCGLPEETAIEKHNNRLHKEHLEHNGSNDITNCVPACKSCNSSKHNFQLDDWYKPDNPIFNTERLNMIHKWLNEDHKKIAKK